MARKKIGKNKAAVSLGRLGGLAGKGSPARAWAARKAAKARWDAAKRLATGVPNDQ